MFLLTITADDGVPLHFRAQSGNVTDDVTHRDTWDLLGQLIGRHDFLYVADSKLATRENLADLHQRQGRFMTVLPKTRSEDAAFRGLVTAGKVNWRLLGKKTAEEGEILDRYLVSDQPATSAEGYRLVWYHSQRKAEQDAMARNGRLQRALKALADLRDKLQSPRTRYRQERKVAEAVAEILASCGAEAWLVTKIQRKEEESFRQARRGRPTKETQYLKKVSTRFDVSWPIDHLRMAEEARSDGVFPLITNVTDLSELELPKTYERQPTIEKRFSQLKTDFEVAPVYLKAVPRIQALLSMYFFALLIEALLKRELRGAMQRHEDEAWEGDFRALPKPMMQNETHYLGIVVTKRAGTVLAETQLEGRPSVNDLATLLVQAMRRPLTGKSHRPSRLDLRGHHQWRELFPHPEDLGIKVAAGKRLPKVEKAYEHHLWQMREARRATMVRPSAGQAAAEELFPAIAKWVRRYGRIEIGEQEMFGFVTQAVSYGGMVFEDDRPETSAEAMAALERALSEYFQQQGIE